MAGWATANGRGRSRCPRNSNRFNDTLERGSGPNCPYIPAPGMTQRYCSPRGLIGSQMWVWAIRCSGSAPLMYVSGMAYQRCPTKYSVMPPDRLRVSSTSRQKQHLSLWKCFGALLRQSVLASKCVCANAVELDINSATIANLQAFTIHPNGCCLTNALAVIHCTANPHTASS